MRKLFWLAGACLLGMGVSAQVRAPSHGAGVLAAGDVDGDGYDDLVVTPPNERAWLYHGSPVAPYVHRAMPLDVPAGFDAPLIQGGHLYVPVLDPGRGKGWVHVFEPGPKGMLRPARTARIVALGPHASVRSVRIAPLDVDADGDGHHDVLVVWSEWSPMRGTTLRAGWVTPSGMARRVSLPPIAGAPAEVGVADVLPSSNLVSSRSEFLVLVSTPRAAVATGFGILPLGPGPRARGAVWFAGAPPLEGRRGDRAAHAGAFGRFQPVPGLPVPVVKLASGPSIHFLPWPVAPFVQRGGALLHTTTRGVTLDACTADYDGDGRTEMVWCEPLHGSSADFVVVADPGSGRAYIQGFDLSRGRVPVTPVHGAAGDFDGDGDPDVVLSCFAKGTSGSYWVMLRNHGGRPGSPALARNY